MRHADPMTEMVNEHLQKRYAVFTAVDYTRGERGGWHEFAGRFENIELLFTRIAQDPHMRLCKHGHVVDLWAGEIIASVWWKGFEA